MTDCRYSLLCKAVDDVCESGNHLRAVMGLPPKDLGLKTDEEPVDQENLLPSQSESPGTCL